MTDLSISATGLSKRYDIDPTRNRNAQRVLTEDLAALFLPWRRPRKTLAWALRDVSFEVKAGQSLGVIGPNGAGKSTLLKILSRITKPSVGRAELYGRVGSLLEVGTGFHSELTGRENIFLGGSVLGMRRHEIRQRFDQIVDFSGISTYLDTPVKRYSTGMRVRLAFAVAAHLEPEILLMDEVLAVGDAEFQRKCLFRMREIVNEGRTILFVSHDLVAVEALCNDAMLLSHGRLQALGPTREVVARFLDQAWQDAEATWDLTAAPYRTNGSHPVFHSLTIATTDGRPVAAVPVGQAIVFEIRLDTKERRLRAPRLGLWITDTLGVDIARLETEVMHGQTFELAGAHTLRCRWDNPDVRPGLYQVELWLDELDRIPWAGTFQIIPNDVYGTGRVDRDPGILVPRGQWELE